MAMNISALFELAAPQAGITATKLPVALDGLFADLMTNALSEPSLVTSFRFEEPSSGPPGTAPPPDIPLAGICGEELKTEEPNAQSKKPDLPAQESQAASMAPLWFPVQAQQLQATPDNEAVQQFLESRGLADAAPVDPVEAAFIQLVSDPGLNVKMVRFESVPVAPAPAEQEVALTKPLLQSEAPDPVVRNVAQQPEASSVPPTDLEVPIVAAPEKKEPTPSQPNLIRREIAAEVDPVMRLLSKQFPTESKGLGAVPTIAVPEPKATPIVQSGSLDLGDGGEDPAAFAQVFVEEIEQEPSKKGNALTTVTPSEIPAAKGAVTTVHPSDLRSESPNALRDRVIHQVADRIEMLAATRKDSITILLDPINLGEIKLVIDQTGGQLDAKVYAQDERVRQVLQASHPQLCQTLDQRGIKLDTFHVSDFAATGHDMAQHREAPGDQRSHAHAPRSTFAAEPSRQPKAAFRSRGVDYTI